MLIDLYEYFTLLVVSDSSSKLSYRDKAHQLFHQFRNLLFISQMKLLTGKKSANNPLYLMLACDQLRYHGVFEEVCINPE